MFERPRKSLPQLKATLRLTAAPHQLCRANGTRANRISSIYGRRGSVPNRTKTDKPIEMRAAQLPESVQAVLSLVLFLPVSKTLEFGPL